MWLALLTLGVLFSGLALAADERGRVLAGNTLIFSGLTSAIALLLGAPLAFLLVRTDARGRRAASVVLAGLLVTPLYVLAAAWQAGFGVQGWCSLAVGGPALMTGWRGAVAIQALAAVPWVVLIVGVGLLWSEAELEEDALLDATPGLVFRRVTLRRAAEALFTALVWVFVTTAGEMTVTDLFLIRTYAEEIYTQFALGDPLDSAAWRIAPSVVSIAWVIALGLYAVGRLIPADRHPTQRPAAPFRLRTWRYAATLTCYAAVGVLLLVPAASLAIKAGRVVVRTGATLERDWSAVQCLAMTLGSPWRFAREMAWTAVIGALAASAAVAIGLPLAWSARGGGWRAAPAWATVAICLAVPGPLVGLAIIKLFNAPQAPILGWLYDHSIAPIWLAQTVRSLPLPTLILWYGLRTIPADVLSSARLDGASPLVRFLRIALPQRWPVLAAAWLVALAVATGELDASILVVPPGVSTLPIQIFGLIHYGVDDQVAGISLFMLVALLGYAVALALVARRAARESSR
ncbi:MAG: ABC transporter permease subunit [Pirellulales bacterium]